MRELKEFRSGKPAFYPDQSIYAEYACAAFGLTFRDIDGGTGLLFTIASPAKALHFGAGRCSWYPQNNATASTLASDKYFTNGILEQAGVATLGGDYFFLHDRHRAFRSAGHERDDAIAYYESLGGTAFIKPLLGSRGDFAQGIEDETALGRYFDEVSRYYDAILIQPLVSGAEYRVFVLDGEILYTARKYPPHLIGDGVHSVEELLAAHNANLRRRGLSPVTSGTTSDSSLKTILPKHERWEIPGRMNLSAGGKMVLEAFPNDTTAKLARRAAGALGLRVAAVDLFTDIHGDSADTRVIEVNSNPSIRLLEEQNRGDLILQIWRHTFSAMGLLRV